MSDRATNTQTGDRVSEPPAEDSRVVVQKFGAAYKSDGESWEAYAHRLERRIKEQRDSLRALQAVHANCGNRASRKRVAHLEAALGRASLRGDKLREAVRALTSRSSSGQDTALSRREPEFDSPSGHSPVVVTTCCIEWPCGCSVDTAFDNGTEFAFVRCETENCWRLADFAVGESADPSAVEREATLRDALQSVLNYCEAVSSRPLPLWATSLAAIARAALAAAEVGNGGR